jgi:branched-chain amino acid aminotransferase
MAEEKPPYMVVDGELVPWEKGTVHLWSEVAVRGSNVFEGIRAYWDSDRQVWNLMAWRAHMRRLFQSARILRMPHGFDEVTFRASTLALLRALNYREPLYIRPTIFVKSGRYGFDPAQTSTGMYVVAFPVPMSRAVRELRCCVSAWVRTGDLQAIPRVKSGGSYNAFRLPRIEAAERACDDAILLNARGTVAEMTGASVFIVRDGVVITPPFSAGTLESITRAACITLIRANGREIVEREVERTELYIADEIFACGTLLEIGSVVAVDGRPVGDGSVGTITREVEAAYRAIALGEAVDDYGWLSEFALSGTTA